MEGNYKKWINRINAKQDVLTEDNVGQFMDSELATKSTPTSGDTVLGRDSLTGKAVEIPTSSFGGGGGGGGDTSNLVPYNNATKNVNIGAYYFESSQGFKKTGGTSNQALTANGGVYDLTTKADLVGGKVPKAQSQPSTMVMDNSTYVITFTDATGAVQTIDLPLESLFKDANYDAQTKSLIVTLDNGTTKSIPLTDLVDLPEIVLSNTNPSVNPTTGQKVYFNTSLGKVWFNVSGAWIFAGNLISDSEKTNLSNAYTHSQATGNPHGTTKTDIGLGNVDNTSDLNKPISTATQNALNTKADIDDIPSKTSFTHDILVSNWSLVSGKYEAVISNAGILSNSFVDVIPSNDHVDIVRAAQIYPSVLISAGSVKVYSKFLPSGTISVTVNIN